VIQRVIPWSRHQQHQAALWWYGRSDDRRLWHRQWGDDRIEAKRVGLADREDRQFWSS